MAAVSYMAPATAIARGTVGIIARVLQHSDLVSATIPMLEVGDSESDSVVLTVGSDLAEPAGAVGPVVPELVGMAAAAAGGAMAVTGITTTMSM